MIRLTLNGNTRKQSRYNKKIFINYYQKDSTYKISTDDDANIRKDTDKALSAIPTVKTYQKFLNSIKKYTERKLVGNYITFLDDKTLYVFFSSTTLLRNSQVKLIVKYEIESDALVDFVKKMYCFTDKKTYLLSSANARNGFVYILPAEILSVLFAKANVEGSGRLLYEQHSKAKKDGGRREYYAPDPELKAALATLNHLLQRVYDRKNADFQVAYKKGKSIKTGALLHVNHNYVFNIDFKDFYPSCKKDLVVKYVDFLFDYSFNRTYLEEEFLKTILINDGLFIGNPCSGTLANVIISAAVSYMKNMVSKYDIALSVYADDITFSSDKFISEDFVNDIFTEAFTKYGLIDYFTLKKEKSVGFSGPNRKVTGVAINDANKVTIPRTYYRTLRAMFNHLSNNDGQVDIRLLKGKLAYATEIDDHGKVYNLISKYSDLVEQYNLCSKDTIEKLKTRCGK